MKGKKTSKTLIKVFPWASPTAAPCHSAHYTQMAQDQRHEDDTAAAVHCDAMMTIQNKP